jgi:ketosteroid isomerase-like protein
MLVCTRPDGLKIGPAAANSLIRRSFPRSSETMKASIQLPVLCLGLLIMSAASAQQSAASPLVEQVRDTERAFAQTMADRDFEAFTNFLSEEAVFFSGNTPLRGKQAVADAWKGYFDGPDAPFSWAPELVEVLESGGLALSSGPVRDPAGNRVATFTSIWRLEQDRRWRIVFDKGSRDCPEPAPDAED